MSGYQPNYPITKLPNDSIFPSAFQHSHLPPVFRAGHDRVVVDLRVIRMDHGVAVENLGIDGGGVSQFNGGSLAGVENGFHFVAAIDDARSQSGLLLVSDAPGQLVLGEADEVVVERGGVVVG